MADSLTLAGQDAALRGGASDGGIARVATNLRLYTSASVPAKDGTGFVEVPQANGYVSGGLPVNQGMWTLSTVSGNRRMVLSDKVWTGSGGSISNIAGAYLTDANGVILAWFERSPSVTILNGDTLTLTNLTVGLV